MDIVNRVTQAISPFGPCHGVLCVFFPLPECGCREAARAAIAAMREPTPAMLAAGMDAYDLLTADQVRPAYKAMIDAALKEPSTGHKD